MNESINIYWPYKKKTSISDQIWALENIFSLSDIPLTISEKLDVSAYNICIEDFNNLAVINISRFCDKYSLRVGLLATEFLEENSTSGYLINGQPHLSSPLRERFDNLLALRSCFNAVFSIACQPDVDSYRKFLSVESGHCLGFPYISSLLRENEEYDFDLYFSGSLTPYRQKILSLLQDQGLKIFREIGFVSERKRIQNLDKSRFILNIPQREDWKWISTMRVLFAANQGKLTIHIGKLANPQLQTVIEIESLSAIGKILELPTIHRDPIEIAALFPKTKELKSNSSGLSLVSE